MSIHAITAPFPGVRRVLEEGEKLGLWRLSVLEGDTRVEHREGDTYLLGAWHPGYETLVAEQHAAGNRVGVLWTSSMGEMGFEPSEMDALGKLIDDDRIDFIWAGSPDLADLHPKIFHTPYPLYFSESIIGKVERPPKMNAFGLFAPNTVKKNLANQIYGARLIQNTNPDLQFHTNTPMRGTWSRWYGPRRVTPHSWLDRGAYWLLVSSLQFTMHVTWAETFSYAAAESILLGTPVICSDAVPFLETSTFGLAKPNHPWSMQQAAHDVIKNPGVAVFLQHANLLDYARNANVALAATLGEIDHPR